MLLVYRIFAEGKPVNDPDLIRPIRERSEATKRQGVFGRALCAIPTYLIDGDEGRPKRLRKGDPRLE